MNPVGETEDRQFGEIVRRFCASWYEREGEDRSRPFEPGLWRRLGEIGVWTAAQHGNGLPTVAAVAEALGHEAIAGPIVGTFMIAQLADDAVADALSEGTVMTVSDGSGPVPWAPLAAAIYRIDDDHRIWEARIMALDPAAPMLDLDPWARATIEDRGEAIAMPEASIAGHVAAGAYAIGAALRILADTRDYLAIRQQFGRPLWSNQSPAHRVARAIAGLHIAAAGIRAAAALPCRTDHAIGVAAGARLHACDAALCAAFLGHQLQGGMGFVDHSLLASLSRRIQMLDHTPPRRAWALAEAHRLIDHFAIAR
jgi:alkylation response protein AidB-like acyl-CoA dehydrogenase